MQNINNLMSFEEYKINILSYISNLLKYKYLDDYEIRELHILYNDINQADTEDEIIDLIKGNLRFFLRRI